MAGVWMRTSFGLALVMGLASCDALPFPGGAPNDVAQVEAAPEQEAQTGTDADIALASNTDAPDVAEKPRRGFFGNLLSRPEDTDTGLSQPDKGAGDEAVGELILTGGIVARAPAGYCVDASADDAPSAASRRVAIMASCESVSGDNQGAAVPSAVLTVTVGRVRVLGADVDGQALAQAFSEQGPRAAKGGEGLAVVQLERGGDEVIAGASPVHWRGMLRVGPRLVGLAVYTPKGSSLVGAPGGDLLRDLADAVRDASVIARRGG